MLGAVMKCLHFRPFGIYIACILYRQLHHEIRISQSDVWLTVHRNSVWIRKTN